MTYRRAIAAINPGLFGVFPFRHLLSIAIDYANQMMEEMAYRYYCTDALMVISKGIGKIAVSESMKKRFADILKDIKQPDTRTETEIRRDMLKKMREDWGETDGEFA